MKISNFIKKKMQTQQTNIPIHLNTKKIKFKKINNNKNNNNYN